VRDGASVLPVLSPAAQRLVRPPAFAAVGCKPAVTSLSGRGEHVAALGDARGGGADLLVLAPATANTVSKVALGVDDNALLTFATTLAARVPILVAPAMHATMLANPPVQENLARLRARGAVVLAARMEEEAAKMASIEEIDAHARRLLSGRPLANRRVLVVAGPTAEPLAEDLVLTNRASGATGVALAEEAFRRGAEVELWMGDVEEPVPTWIGFRRFSTVDDLLALAPLARGFDAVFVPAAVGDYAPAARANGPGEVPLRPLPKFVDAVRKHFAGPLVAWKAQAGGDDAALRRRAQELRARLDATLVVGNRVEDVSAARTRALLVAARSAQPFEGTREALAAALLEAVFPRR